MVKVLVTGGTGFIGSHLAKRLYHQGYEVTVFAQHATTPWYNLPEGIKVYVVDLADKNLLRAGCTTGFDYVYHLAVARDSVGRDRCYKTNVLGTRNLLEILVEKNVKLKKFIYISSLGAAGFSRDGSPKRETDPMEPVSFYGQTKMMAEKEVMNFRGKFPFIILRPPKVYGPGDKKVLFHFKLVKYGIVPDIGLKTRFMSLCYVEDFVNALILAAESKITDNVYFVSDGNSYSWETFYETIAQVLGRKMRRLVIPPCLISTALYLSKIIIKLPLLPFTIEPTTLLELGSKYWTCCPEKFFKEFSFKPQADIENGFKKTADWFIEKKLL